MKVFRSVAPFAFAPKTEWYQEKINQTWDVFVPLLNLYNDRRRKLFKPNIPMAVMLDEAMSALVPKTSKTGGMPNITFEPRKPKPMGTMLRNAIEVYTGSLLYQDTVMLPELQARKEFHDDVSHMPDKSNVTGSVAEVLRQAKNMNLARKSWIGGDAWFGCVMSCVKIVTCW